MLSFRNNLGISLLSISLNSIPSCCLPSVGLIPIAAGTSSFQNDGREISVLYKEPNCLSQVFSPMSYSFQTFSTIQERGHPKGIKCNVWIEALLLLILKTVFSPLSDTMASSVVERMSFAILNKLTDF